MKMKVCNWLPGRHIDLGTPEYNKTKRKRKFYQTNKQIKLLTISHILNFRFLNRQRKGKDHELNNSKKSTNFIFSKHLYKFCFPLLMFFSNYLNFSAYAKDILAVIILLL
jgi:hypothetical protein